MMLPRLTFQAASSRVVRSEDTCACAYHLEDDDTIIYNCAAMSSVVAINVDVACFSPRAIFYRASYKSTISRDSDSVANCAAIAADTRIR